MFIGCERLSMASLRNAINVWPAQKANRAPSQNWRICSDSVPAADANSRNFHDFRSIWTAYHFNFAGIDRNLSKGSFMRWVISGAPGAASAFNVVAMA